MKKEPTSPCCSALIIYRSHLPKCSKCDRLLGQQGHDIGGPVFANSSNSSFVGGIASSGYRKGSRNTGGLGGQ